MNRPHNPRLTVSGKEHHMHILLLFAMLHYWPVGPQPVGIGNTTHRINVHAIGPVSTGLHGF